MYCKRCGRKLDDSSRFCDRCGKSVKNNNEKTRKQEIEELAESRIERSNKRKERENNKQTKKGHVSDKTVIITIAVIVIVILTASAIIPYVLMTRESDNAIWRSQDGTVAINATPTPEVEESTNNEPSSTPYTLTENINEDGYSLYEFDGREFLYPSIFKKANTGGVAKLKLVDGEGEGIIELNTETAVSTKAHDLMLEFAKSSPENEVVLSRAGADWYIIDIENSGNVIHRKCVISEGIAISYDFTYSATSKYLSLYKQYINYMDEAFNY